MSDEWVTRPHGPEIVLISGGRDCTHESHGDIIRGDIFGLRKGSIIIHGGAKGADSIADFHARKLGFHVARMDALWGYHGKSAGPKRNHALLMLRPTFAFCYPTGGPGTAGMIELLRSLRITHIIRNPTPLGDAGLPDRAIVREPFGANLAEEFAE